MNNAPNDPLSDPCPCGRGAYATCCGPCLTGERLPATAEALMRSRFTAYARGDSAWIVATHRGLAPEAAAVIARQNRGVRWTRLDIRRTEAGGPTDDTGLVEFIAFFMQRGKPGRLHEVSRFERVDGRWMYVGGDHRRGR